MEVKMRKVKWSFVARHNNGYGVFRNRATQELKVLKIRNGTYMSQSGKNHFGITGDGNDF